MNIKKMLAGLILITLLAVLTGCTSKTDKIGKDKNIYSKDAIQDKLNSSKGVSKITWSPDNKKVVYLQESADGNNGSDKIYIWRVDKEQAEAAQDVSLEVFGFVWSPDSKYFLISEKQGEKYENTIVKAEDLVQEKYKISSTGLPVWSPESLSLAFSNDAEFYGEKWGYLEVYTIGKDESEYIWKSHNTQYKVETWDKDGNIGYIEVFEGKESKKTVKNIRPSISGVHLGDSREQVKEALGDGYKETPPTGESGHFTEQVYRWDYEKGYTIWIGEKSGKVLEISATSPEAETNLGIKIGDKGDKVFEIYRSQYIEPESIHGGKLYGVFKVEGAAALSFGFDTDEGQTQFPRNIKPESRVIRMMLTYPENMDDSF